jgi:hypothetical protein
VTTGVILSILGQLSYNACWAGPVPCGLGPVLDHNCSPVFDFLKFFPIKVFRKNMK